MKENCFKDSSKWHRSESIVTAGEKRHENRSQTTLTLTPWSLNSFAIPRITLDTLEDAIWLRKSWLYQLYQGAKAGCQREKEREKERDFYWMETSGQMESCEWSDLYLFSISTFRRIFDTIHAPDYHVAFRWSEMFFHKYIKIYIFYLTVNISRIRFETFNQTDFYVTWLNYRLKLSPQPQVPLMLGLLNTNSEVNLVVTKSISVPRRDNWALESIRTRAPSWITSSSMACFLVAYSSV